MNEERSWQIASKHFKPGGVIAWSEFYACCRCFASMTVLAANGRGEQADLSEAKKGLSPQLEKLLPLHTRLGKPGRGDWLAEQLRTRPDLWPIPGRAAEAGR